MSQSKPTNDDDSISSVLITGTKQSHGDLVSAAGVDVVRGSAVDLDDHTRSVVAYATGTAVANLRDSGFEVTTLANPQSMQARWESVRVEHAATHSAGYKLSSSIDDALQGMATQYGLTCSKFYLNQRTNGLSRVPAARIQDGTDSSLIPVLFTGGVHARELAPPDALLSFCEALLDADANGTDVVYLPFTDASGTKYPQYIVENATVKRILKRFILFVVPCVNPDGRDFSLSAADDEHKLWRKNRRYDPTCWGVDINRNFPFVWDADVYYESSVVPTVSSSKEQCADKFRGYDTPEPETQNMVDLVAEQSIQYLVDVHMFGRWILYPWGMDTNQLSSTSQSFLNTNFDGKRDGPASNAYGEYIPGSLWTKLVQLADAMSREILRSAGSDTTAIAQSAYTTSQSVRLGATTGAFDDYTFGQQFVHPDPDPKAQPQTCSFTLECGHLDDGEFAPDYATQYPKVEREVHAALFGLLDAI